MKIKLFITGGTIDKVYNERTGELEFTSTHVIDMLKHARARVELDIAELMLVDSNRMTDEQRHQILQACKETSENKIVITHGTGSMVRTAELIGANIKDKTVVLLGSMVPYEFGSSDALFNLGGALTAVQILDSGTYITMNGKIFKWDNVIENKEIYEFQEKT